MALTDDELLQKWNTETNFDQRDRIVSEMITRKLFPQGEENKAEEEGGLYPAIDDPLFLQKLLRKQEFAEHKQPTLLDLIRSGENPCDPNQEFELSPVQRFIAQYLSPKTPYNSALLYHGVGVGKTCSAITVAEAYLEMFPRKQVIIVAPPNIQPGFERTIFNEDGLRIPEEEGVATTFNGCTGNTYLQLTGTEFVKDKKEIMKRVSRLRAKRYQLFGYTQFYNYIKNILNTKYLQAIKDPKRKAQEEKRLLQREFDGRLLIIDEAHNLRDIAGESAEENRDAPGGLGEIAESAAGKLLTPYLKKVLEVSDGLKLLLLTATPMYNSYIEILFLFNLLLLNDKRAQLHENDIFSRDGNFVQGGKEILGKVASVYLSFMRGENPLSFPVRLEPLNVNRVTEWPHKAPNGETISEDERVQLKNLPFVSCPFQGDSFAVYRQLAEQSIREGGLSLNTVDTMIQAGNWMFPGDGSGEMLGRVREAGFTSTFIEESRGSLKVFKAKPDVPATWLRQDRIGEYSPKTAFILQRLRTSRGVSFVYSRFVKSGALSLAMALEANGYTLYGRESPFLLDGIQGDEGRQCALCERRERQHAGANHNFVAAKYVLLTGRDEYSPNNKLSVDTARSDDNKDGRLVKVVVGSQVASEGIDLRFIRDVFVFDSWFHLNKLEQVIGRAIRMCSHALLPKDERNCTIYLLLSTFPREMDQETLDMYQYRNGFRKALQVGRVTRTLKQYAIDCNLNRDAILISGLPPIKQVDSQMTVRDDVNVNDMPFTSVCDWIETCDYRCAVPIEIDPLKSDDSTYDEYAAKWREAQVRERLRKLFERQPFYRFEDLHGLMIDIPRIALASILVDVAGNRSFRIHVGTQDGYIVYKNGFYLFQPELLKDTSLPLALRIAPFPVKRDSYEPTIIPKVVSETPSMLPPPAIAAATAATGTTVPVTTAPKVTTVKEEEKKENMGLVMEGYSEFWDATTAWAQSLANGEDVFAIPNGMLNAINKRYGSYAKSKQRVIDALGMIPWFYKLVQTNEAERVLFASGAAEFIWDEYLTPFEQYKIYEEKKASADPSSVASWSEHILTSGSAIGYRFLDPRTGKLQYLCDGKPCSPALIRVFEEDPSDKLRGLKADTTTTAPIYGTVSYKDGLFVFKTNKPVTPDKKHPERGSECANVSNISSHYELLEQIGKLTQETMGTNFGLTKEEMKFSPTRSFQNSVRACALTDVILRYLDKKMLRQRRWFYRPIAAFKTNHPGKLKKK